ncbi:MAG: ribbon-helix-helix domain-containing protein [Deltaproteobacteria bacterium]|nr:ribbon-helix-helix domain-containing protein [Deltaproteobacteria bacterium]
MGRRKITTTVYLEPHQTVMLKALAERTQVPVAEYIRQGIDRILAEHAALLPGQLGLFDPRQLGLFPLETLKAEASPLLAAAPAGSARPRPGGNDEPDPAPT